MTHPVTLEQGLRDILASEDDLAAEFEYLDDLRESGRTNMFGAGSYLQRERGLSRTDASDILGAWMKSFDGAKHPADRAKEWLDQQVSA